MRRTALPLLAVLAAVALLSGACAAKPGEDPLAVNGDQGFDASGSLDGRIDPSTGLRGGDAPTSDQVVRAALEDVDAFWSREYEDLYGDPYEPVEGGYWPYGPRSQQPPCGSPPPDYADIAENAFYCPSADLIAWDNVNLVPGMYRQFGGFTLGIVFAHEFGHAVQTRAGVVGDTIMTELQADCFAGAWTADVADGGSEHFELALADLDRAIAGFLELRDGVGGDASDPTAHGTGFDRIGAFSEGFESGLERCAAYPELYETGELVIVEFTFTSQEDFDNEGNLPLDQIAELSIQDLEHFWSVVFDELGQSWTPVTDVVGIDPDEDTVSCGDDSYEGDVLVNASFYCVPDDTIFIDTRYLVPTLYDIGDYAVATELARQYAYAAQVRLGNLDNDLGSNLQADCYAGVYAYSGFSVNRGADQILQLSPGDLDEAVIGFLLRSDNSEDVEAGGDVSVGTAFQRFDAYRTGFLSGISECDRIAEDR